MTREGTGTAGPGDGNTPDPPADLAERGRAVMAEVMCAEVPDSVGEPGSLGDLAARHIFGDLWDRPGLSRRERRIVTLTLLAALGQGGPHASLHIKAALASGDLTEAELHEMSVQMAYYAGWPLATSFGWAVDEATGRSGTSDAVRDLATGPAGRATAGPDGQTEDGR
ncbi:carboxymuconolactone decarboxylase family protein [Streptomyces sp. NBC_01387]|uniref:carboxymuconolactone decarboxylase family protein n=1 Tax=unclassified Streptomyces TaxID=2593676 RepID=UPI002024A938|nr:MULTISPECIES: carboxymuconolactone decarboxylase family protein [unclassified Streptomyces]WSC19315.1 carboxymuconolactone decarboxylase family protein [Streptomyces sp. NBC_01766]WSV53338.1 carboxymuconolactone decarboxylase family protein [Streptomyces sp. NBC_01014]